MKSQDFLIEYYQQLDEIAMNPNRLRKMADGIGAMVGIEFEMVVPDVAGNDEDAELEPDYDQDRRIRGFRDIRDFFLDGEFNSRRDIERAMDSIWSDYMDSDWLSERKQEEWSAVADKSIRDLVARDYEDEFYDQAVEEIKDKTPEFGTNDEEFRAAVNERHQELIDEKVEDILANMGSEYDEAFDEWVDNEWLEMSSDDDMFTDWLRNENITTMQDIESNYQITWPYFTTAAREGTSIEEIADDFSNAIGRPVEWSERYHGGRRRPGYYTVEPDSSIRGDEGESGLEFISPPLPIGEMIADLKDVQRWAKKVGAYTNESTGLHINVSVPDWEGESGKLDYVKLALLLGDEHVLEAFGRRGNTYTKSAFDVIKQRVRQNPDVAEQVLAKMKSHLNAEASRLIHSGITDKYISIHPKGGYIEFRSPGGDWLDSNFKEIESTLLRFVVALDAAVHEDKYKEEYAKKLYKLLAPSNDESDTLKYFARYSAGELPKSALRSFVKQAQLQRQLKKGPTGVKYWWEVSRPDSYASIEVVATSREEAIEKAIGEYPDWKFAKNIVAKAMRPFETTPVRATSGAPQPAGAVGEPIPGSTLDLARQRAAQQVGGEQSSDANYEIIDRNTNRPVFRFIANTDGEAQRKYSDWLSGQGLSNDTENYGWRAILRSR